MLPTHMIDINLVVPNGMHLVDEIIELVILVIDDCVQFIAGLKSNWH